MNDHTFYHYAPAESEPFDKLRTVRNQAKQKGHAIHEPYPSYSDSVSFFMDPPPLQELPGIYSGAHPFWQSGKEIYQYTVDISRHRGDDFIYKLVESPETTALYYDDSIGDEQYAERVADIIKEHHYLGHSVSALMGAVKTFKRRQSKDYMLKAYKDLVKRPNFEQIKTKYAPTVPHLMVYDKTGEFIIQSVTKVILGQPATEAYSVPSMPSYLKW